MQVLAEITQTWSVMSLSYESHSSTGTPLLKADENLIETLEDNQVTKTKICFPFVHLGLLNILKST